MDPAGEVLIKAEDVSKSVLGPEGRIDILARVSLSLERGSSLAIVGASGSGKTTLLGLLAGLDTPSSGAITVAGLRLDQLTKSSARNCAVPVSASCSSRFTCCPHSMRSRT
jgi:putative ABC transport system ATP-binding protein